MPGRQPGRAGAWLRMGGLSDGEGAQGADGASFQALHETPSCSSALPTPTLLPPLPGTQWSLSA